MSNYIPDLTAQPVWADYRRQRGRWLAYHVIPQLVGKLHTLRCVVSLHNEADTVHVLASGWPKVKLLVETQAGVGWELRLRLGNDTRNPYFEAKELGGGRRFESTSLEQLVGRMNEYQSPSLVASMQSLRAKKSNKTRIEDVP